MADEIEVETKDLQETIEELHKEREEREAEERKEHWTRYIALTTAVLAAFGAIAALESGSLANEGMMNQLEASDTWNEYQASRTKTHLYGIAAASLIDRGVALPKPEPKKPAASAAPKKGISEPDVKTEPVEKRLSGYIAEIDHENDKTKTLSAKADKLQKESKEQFHGHHRFAYSVALLQVAIALGAVSALTRMKSVWLISMALGIAGIAYFAMGFLAR